MTDNEETELRNKISILEIRNLELVGELVKENRTLDRRFTDNEIVRIIRIVDTLRYKENDY